jgi:hypothetical protein
MGHPPVIRVPILNGNGVAAYHAHREQILAALRWLLPIIAMKAPEFLWVV